MNLGFNGKDETKNEKSAGYKVGSYEDMVKARKEQMPEMQKQIQKVFDNWAGETVVIIKVDNDENGNPSGINELICGVDKPEAIIAVIKQLGRTQDSLIETVQKSGDPKILLKLMVDMLKNMSEEFDDDKKD